MNPIIPIGLIVLLTFSACATGGSGPAPMADPDCTSEPSAEERNRCFVAAFAACRPASVEIRDESGWSMRFVVMPGEGGACTAQIETFDAAGRTADRRECATLLIDLKQGFRLAPFPSCKQIAADPPPADAALSATE